MAHPTYEGLYPDLHHHVAYKNHHGSLHYKNRHGYIDNVGISWWLSRECVGIIPTLIRLRKLWLIVAHLCDVALRQTLACQAMHHI